MTGKNRATAFTRPLRTIFDLGAVAGLTDGELLERFASRRGESAELAFAAILERHGPMVLRVCRKVLGDRHDALDAFQATFLVFVRRAGSVRKADSVASWLHGVAYRVAMSDRAATARRRKHERRASETQEQDGGMGEPDDLGPLLHRELDRLPERYRAPLVLCHLEGLTHEQAAERLNWPVGTVKSRMARGRARLRDRLTGRGLDPSAGFGVAGSSAPTAIAMDATARAATRLAAGQPIAGTVPASTVALMQGVLKAMTLKKIKLAMAGLLAAGIVATAAGVLAQQPQPRPLPAPNGGPDIAYETSFLEITGLAWRGDFHKRLRPVTRKGPYTVWEVDGETLKEILGRGKAVRAPKVTAFADAKAMIVSQTKTKILAGFKKGITARTQRVERVISGEKVIFTFTGTYVTLHGPQNLHGPQDSTPPPKALDFEEIPDGVQVRISGHRVEKGLMVRAELESSRIVSMTGYSVPETFTDGDMTLQANFMVQVPEVIQSRFEGEWLVPTDGALIVGLGIHGSHREGSPMEYSEQLVAFKAGEIALLPSSREPSPGAR